MASPRTQALWIDLGLGGAALVFGTLARGFPTTTAGAALAGLGALVFVGALFVAERVSLLSVVDKNRPASIILVGTTFIVLGGALAVGRAFVVSPAATLLCGTGLGLILYRALYGVVYPLPDRRLRQAQQWGEPPQLGEP